MGRRRAKMNITLDELRALLELPDELTQEKSSALSAWIQEAIAFQNLDFCTHYINVLVSSSLSTSFCDKLVREACEFAVNLGQEKREAFLRHALQTTQGKGVCYEEATMIVSDFLSELYVEKEEWVSAAETLARADLDGSGVKRLKAEEVLGRYLEVAKLFLKGGDTEAAERFLKRASTLVNMSKNYNLDLKYNSLYAELLDRTMRFTEASFRYYELSGCDAYGTQQDQYKALEASITCAILSAAGPQRSRILGLLYKDRRVQNVPQYPILEKVYLERLLQPEEVHAFSKTLASHQLAFLPEESITVLDRAIIEHNLEACSKVYTNITMESLALRLNLKEEMTQNMVARMAGEGRLPAEIDQVLNLVRFTETDSCMKRWNMNIQELCRLSDTILLIPDE